MGRLDGKVAIITGGARGTGAATAKRFVEEGAHVVIADVLDEQGQATATELGATYAHLDITEETQWDDVVAVTVEMFGRLDVLVNNAAVLLLASLANTSVEDFDRVMRVNVRGTFLGIKAAIEPMKTAGGGSIINVSSLAGMRGEAAMPGYVATKFAVRGLTKAAALDLARYGIRVNSIHPGIVHTPLSAEGPKVSMSHVAMDRVGEAFEIANLTVFLASDESSYSTGAEFVADGGEFAGLIRQSAGTATRASSAGR